MSQLPYRFEIQTSVPLTEAEMTLQLAMLALEGLHGQARVRLEARYEVDEPHRTLVVEGGTDVGADLVRVFTSLLSREFGEDSFAVTAAKTSADPAIGSATPEVPAQA